jgi:hypothetical protein
MKQGKAYLSSSTDLLRTLKGLPLPANAVMLSADVRAMYPSIPINDGVAAVGRMLRKYGLQAGLSHTEFPFILALLQFVMLNDFVEFNGCIYLQINGTAMGTPCAVVFECIFMMNGEERVLDALRLAGCDRLGFKSPFFRATHRIFYLYKRFIDDLFAIFGSEEEAAQFMAIMGTIHPSIKFDHILSLLSVNYLDLTIYKACVPSIHQRANQGNKNDVQ